MRVQNTLEDISKYKTFFAKIPNTLHPQNRRFRALVNYAHTLFGLTAPQIFAEEGVLTFFWNTDTATLQIELEPDASYQFYYEAEDDQRYGKVKDGIPEDLVEVFKSFIGAR